MRPFLFILILGFGYSSMCQGVLKKPFKYLNPAPELDLVRDDRRIGLEWTIYPDRKGVVVFADSIGNEVKPSQVRFLETCYAIEESENRLLLVTDPQLELGRLSDNFKEIGWVDKSELILWEKYLIGEGTTLLGVSKDDYHTNSVSVDLVEPSHFENKPKVGFPFYIYFILKLTEEKALISRSSTFYPEEKGDYAWVDRDDLIILGSRDSLYPPVGEVTNEGFENNIFVDERFTSGPFRRITDKNDSVDDPNTLEPCMLFNNAERIQLIDLLDALSSSKSKDQMSQTWRDFFAHANIPLDQSNDLLTLMSQLLKIDLFDSKTGKGSPLTKLSLARSKDFEILLSDFQTSYDSIQTLVGSRYAFTPDNLTYYFIPKRFLPFKALTHPFEYYRETTTLANVEHWIPSQEEATYEVLNVFYILDFDREMDYSQKDALIRKFYYTALEIEEAEGQGVLYYYSNLDEPIVGNDESTINEIARYMREQTPPLPNTYFDKKLLRSNLYQVNVIKSNKINFHVFTSGEFLTSSYLNSRRVLKEFVDEYKMEVNAETLDMILYIPNGENEKLEKAISKLEARKSFGVNYRLEKINP